MKRETSGLELALEVGLLIRELWEPNFETGVIFPTVSAAELIPPEEAFAALIRHAKCDWGDVDHRQRFENDVALETNRSIISVYHTTDGVEFWIVTTGDRSSTGILMPDEV